MTPGDDRRRGRSEEPRDGAWPHGEDASRTSDAAWPHGETGGPGRRPVDGRYPDERPYPGGRRRPDDRRASGTGGWADRLGERRYDYGPRRDRRDDGREGVDPGLFDDNILSFAFRYPFGRGGTAVVLTMVFSLFSFLVVPALLMTGYLLRLAGTAARAEQPAGHERIGSMLALGFLGSLGFLAYVIAVGVIVYVALPVNSVLAAVFTVAGGYFVPAIPTVFAATGGRPVRAVVDRVFAFAFTRHYLAYFVGFLAIFAVTATLGTFLMFIVPFGGLFTPLAAIPTAAYWGQVYGRAIEKGVVRPLPADV